MPDYDRHSRDGKYLGIVLAPIAAYLTWDATHDPLVTLGFAVGALSYSIVGVTLPDLDSWDSIPRQRARKLVTYGLIIVPAAALAFASESTFALMAGLLEFVGVTPDRTQVFGGAVLVMLVGAVAGDDATDLVLPNNHRGILHSLLFWVALAATAGVFAHKFVIPRLGIHIDSETLTAAFAFVVFAPPAAHILRDRFS